MSELLIIPEQRRVGGPRRANNLCWRVLGMDGAAPRLAELLRKYADRADFEIYRTGTGKRLEILP